MGNTGRGGKRAGAGRPVKAEEDKNPRSQRQIRAYDDEFIIIKKFVKSLRNNPVLTNRCLNLMEEGAIKMFSSKVVEILCKHAPRAVFTKAEAVAICSHILEKEVEEYEEDESYLQIEFSVEDFDDAECNFDDLLDNVKFIDWEIIDSVIFSKKIDLEER